MKKAEELTERWPNREKRGKRRLGFRVRKKCIYSSPKERLRDKSRSRKGRNQESVKRREWTERELV